MQQTKIKHTADSQNKEGIWSVGLGALQLTIHVYVNKQASMLAATSHSAEVSKLKQSLERAEEELGRVKKQLEDKQGMQWPIQI